MTSRLKRRTGLVLLGLAEVAAAAIALLTLLAPASAQIDDRFPFMEDRRRRYQQTYPQQQYSPFGFEQQRQQSGDSSRAPAPRRTDNTPTTKVVVFGDSMADWLAYGLEEAFADTPDIGVLRKQRTNSGLIRIDNYDWPTTAREILAAEKPDYVVMMIGLSDRRGIREAIRQPARPPAGQKQQSQTQQGVQAGAQPTPQASPGAPAGAQPPAAAPAVPAQPAPAKPTDAEGPPQQPQAQDTAQDDQQNLIAPEGAIAGTVVHEFRSEKWGELYSRRVDEMIGVLKSRNVPVFWVGLPPVRGSRATSEMVYLNDLYRGRAEKAGITYIDVWDGFVDESGNYNNYGPDLEGQTRRLRSGDGAHFTRAGARKLAHYVEREIRRVMMANVPVATPLPQEPEPDTKAPPTAAAPGLPPPPRPPAPDPTPGAPRAAAAPAAPPRPAASPVMSLTAPKGAGDTLLGATPVRNTSSDSVATRVLVKGEPLEAPAGRAD